MIKKIWQYFFGKDECKCDYCNKAIEQYYDAWMFPMEPGEYKGHIICIDCIKDLDNPNVIII